MEKFIEFVLVILILVAFYFIFDIFKFVVQYWYVFFILGAVCLVYEFFTDTGSFAPGSSSVSNPIEGDYTVYDLGKEKPQVDRLHINKGP